DRLDPLLDSEGTNDLTRGGVPELQVPTAPTLCCLPAARQHACAVRRERDSADQIRIFEGAQSTSRGTVPERDRLAFADQNPPVIGREPHRIDNIRVPLECAE